LLLWQALFAGFHKAAIAVLSVKRSIFPNEIKAFQRYGQKCHSATNLVHKQLCRVCWHFRDDATATNEKNSVINQTLKQILEGGDGAARLCS